SIDCRRCEPERSPRFLPLSSTWLPPPLGGLTEEASISAPHEVARVPRRARRGRPLPGTPGSAAQAVALTHDATIVPAHPQYRLVGDRELERRQASCRRTISD